MDFYFEHAMLAQMRNKVKLLTGNQHGQHYSKVKTICFNNFHHKRNKLNSPHIISYNLFCKDIRGNSKFPCLENKYYEEYFFSVRTN